MELVEHWGSPHSVIARGTKNFPFLRWRGWVWGKREKKEHETRAHTETFQNVLKDAGKWRVLFFADHVNIIFNLTSFIMTPLEGWNMHSYQLLLFDLKHACWVVVGFYTWEVKRSRMLEEKYISEALFVKMSTKNFTAFINRWKGNSSQFDLPTFPGVSVGDTAKPGAVCFWLKLHYSRFAL